MVTRVLGAAALALALAVTPAAARKPSESSGRQLQRQGMQATAIGQAGPATAAPAKKKRFGIGLGDVLKVVTPKIPVP